MDIHSFIRRLDNNTDELLSLAKSLTANQLSFKEADKWNVLEILEHIYLGDKVVILLLNKPAEQTHTEEHIYGDTKMERIVVGMRNRKVVSPEFLKPKGKFSAISDFEKVFVEQRNKLKNSLLTNAIIIDNRVHKHPYLGEMTISDWLYFIIHHSQRHIEQIKETVANSHL